MAAGRKMAPDIADTVWLCGQQIHIHSKSANIVTADECRGHFETPLCALCPAYEISCHVLGAGDYTDPSFVQL